MPAIQKQVLDQLLGQSAATLHYMAGEKIGQSRARDRRKIDTVMVFEIAILDCLQTSNQQWRQLLERDHSALFLLVAVQRGDARRIQSRLCQRRTGVGIAQIRNHIVR